MSTTVTAEPELDDVELPADLAEAFRAVGDRDEPPATLEAGFAIVGEVLDRQELDLELEDMYRTEPTRHAVHVGRAVEHVPCVLDALIVALVVDEDPVEVRSEPPNGGEPVEFQVDDGTVSVTPGEAVTSFGVADEDVEGGFSTADELTGDRTAVPSTCSVINAFPDAAAYAEWAAGVTGAAVMELEVPELVTVARGAAERYVDD